MSSCREEILAAVAALRVRNGGQPVSPIEIIREVSTAGTGYPESTIRAEIVSRMCVNAPDNHMTNWPDLLRVGRGLYVPNPATPAPHVASVSAPFRRDLQPASPPDHHGHEWFWEGNVQSLFAAAIREHGWTVTSMADTATKAHGVDVLAGRGTRLLGAEVKGWPSSRYADPRRAEETKPTQATTQAGHWFAQALLKATMQLQTHPERESLMVLPNYPRYRDLAQRTATGRASAGVHVVLVDQAGEAASDTWRS